MALLAPRLIRPTGKSYTSHRRRSPMWSSGLAEKAGAEVKPPAARSREQTPPPAMRTPDRHQMNGEE